MIYNVDVNNMESVNVQMQYEDFDRGTLNLFPTSFAWNIIIDDKLTTLDKWVDAQELAHNTIDKKLQKLETVEWYAEENQPAFSSFRFNEDAIHATDKRDTLIIELGDLLEVTVKDKTATINAKKQDTLATEKNHGLLSKEDYTKLQSIEEDANNYIHPKSGVVAGTYHKVSVDAEGHVIEASEEPLSIAEGGTGGRSLAEVKELLEIPTIWVLDKLDENSMMPVSSKVTFDELAKKAEKEHGNHVPDTETFFNSRRFLIEGNRWEFLPMATEEDIGAVRLTQDINLKDPSAVLSVVALSGQLSMLQSYIDTKFSDLVGGADEAYDTLRELQEWVQQNRTFYDGLAEITSRKVDKIEGKGLSTNDLTNELLEKLTNAYDFITQYQQSLIAAERNIIVSISRNGTTIEPDENRNVNLVVPVKVSELENDAKYLTEHPIIVTQNGTDAAKPLNAGDSVNLISEIIRDSNGHVTGFETKTVTLTNAIKNPNKFGINVNGAVQSVYDGSVEQIVNLLAGSNMKVEIAADGIKFTPNYPEATDGTSGLMGAAEHAKLTGIAANANNYSLPTAGKNKLGGVQTSSNVTDITNYTPTPIVNGIPYYQKSVVDVLTAAPANPPVGYMWVVR